MRLRKILSNIIIIALVLFFTIGLTLSFIEVGNEQEGIKFIRTPEEVRLTRVAYISGAVKNPGVYQIEEFTRINDLANLAGGFSGDADLNFINEKVNLAAKVKDEEHIFVPSKTKESLTDSSDKISINSSTKTELESLPSIGPSTADKIIKNRPYEKLEDLLEVSGIGDKTFEKIKDLISI